MKRSKEKNAFMLQFKINAISPAAKTSERNTGVIENSFSVLRYTPPESASLEKNQIRSSPSGPDVNEYLVYAECPAHCT